MANKFYPLGLEGFAGGDLAWDTDTIKVAGCSSTYVYSASHQFLSSVTGILSTTAALSSKTYALGVLDAADTVFTAVTSGSTLTQLIVYQDTGSAATSRLLLHYDTKSDTTAISVVTNGGDITITWSNSADKMAHL